MITLPTLDDIRAAAALLAPHIIRSPLSGFGAPDAGGEISLKLENLQPIGVFKVRSMGNAVLSADRDALRHGVYTASSGNAGLGLAWAARIRGVPATVYVPESAPQDKLGALARYGARLNVLPDPEWWQLIKQAGHPTDPGRYIDAVRAPAALAGNGTIGLEISAQCPGAATVVVPFGGGGVACGVAAALRVLQPRARIIVAECETSTPLSAAFAAGRPVETDVAPSFISGAGAPRVLDEMWPLLTDLVDDTIVCTLAEVRGAMRQLAERNHVIVEGAGAISVAAANSGRLPPGKAVCVVTGGNVDRQLMADILHDT